MKCHVSAELLSTSDLALGKKLKAAEGVEVPSECATKLTSDYTLCVVKGLSVYALTSDESCVSCD